MFQFSPPPMCPPPKCKWNRNEQQSEHKNCLLLGRGMSDLGTRLGTQDQKKRLTEKQAGG